MRSQVWEEFKEGCSKQREQQVQSQRADRSWQVRGGENDPASLAWLTGAKTGG